MLGRDKGIKSFISFSCARPISTIPLFRNGSQLDALDINEEEGEGEGAKRKWKRGEEVEGERDGEY